MTFSSKIQELSAEEISKAQVFIRPEDLFAFAWLGGDENPIHLDSKAAQSMGLPDVIAHGMHMYSFIQCHVELFLKKAKGHDWKLEKSQCKFQEIALVNRNYFLNLECTDVSEEQFKIKATLHSEECENAHCTLIFNAKK